MKHIFHMKCLKISIISSTSCSIWFTFLYEWLNEQQNHYTTITGNTGGLGVVKFETHKLHRGKWNPGATKLRTAASALIIPSFKFVSQAPQIFKWNTESVEFPFNCWDNDTNSFKLRLQTKVLHLLLSSKPGWSQNVSVHEQILYFADLICFLFYKFFVFLFLVKAFAINLVKTWLQ